jgi:putative phosphoribosyl transferase
MNGFRNRADAGQLLARKLTVYVNQNDISIYVLALPRGGVPVAFEIAHVLAAPLDVCVVRKLGVPGHEELAMGAIASGGVRVLNRDVVELLKIPERIVDAVSAREKNELQWRERVYRGDRPPLTLKDAIVILVDDGIATGATMQAAIQALRQQEPVCLVVATPVAPPDICALFTELADEFVCLIQPSLFISVGAWYRDFRPVTDEEVRGLLDSVRPWQKPVTGHRVPS